MKLNIEFGIPEHGWLPISIKHGDFEIELDVSDVPIDPIAKLCDSLLQLLKGRNIPERILWFLEPYCYYLQLEKSEKEFKVIILESDNQNSPIKITKEIIGNFESIIIPIFRELKRFESCSFQTPNWERLEPEKIVELTKLIEKAK